MFQVWRSVFFAGVSQAARRVGTLEDAESLRPVGPAATGPRRGHGAVQRLSGQKVDQDEREARVRRQRLYIRRHMTVGYELSRQNVLQRS